MEYRYSLMKFAILKEMAVQEAWFSFPVSFNNTLKINITPLNPIHDGG